MLVGGLLIAGGVAWAHDYRHLLSRYYALVIRWWDKIAVIGQAYKQVVPFGQIRYLGSIVALGMGLLFCVLGIGSLIVA